LNGGGGRVCKVFANSDNLLAGSMRGKWAYGAARKCTG
jgi:hypothetical protein